MIYRSSRRKTGLMWVKYGAICSSLQQFYKVYGARISRRAAGLLVPPARTSPRRTDFTSRLKVSDRFFLNPKCSLCLYDPILDDVVLNTQFRPPWDDEEAAFVGHHRWCKLQKHRFFSSVMSWSSLLGNREDPWDLVLIHSSVLSGIMIDHQGALLVLLLSFDTYVWYLRVLRSLLPRVNRVFWSFDALNVVELPWLTADDGGRWMSGHMTWCLISEQNYSDHGSMWQLEVRCS